MMIHQNATCPRRPVGFAQVHPQSEFIRGLAPAALARLSSLQRIASYRSRTILFLEKDIPAGVFIVLEGRIKLSVSSSEGKKLILRFAEPTELLDITAVILGTPYDFCAETSHDSKTGFIYRNDFLQFLVEYPDAQLGLAREIGRNYQFACKKLRSVILSSSVSERLAALLLEWIAIGRRTHQGVSVTIPITQGEIGECIGTTRETVTRTLSNFQHRKLIQWQGARLVIPNLAALETLAGTWTHIPEHREQPLSIFCCNNGYARTRSGRTQN